MILDEGHAIRNPNAQQTKAVLDLEAERRWVLTGNDMDFEITYTISLDFEIAFTLEKLIPKYILLSKLWGNL